MGCPSDSDSDTDYNSDSDSNFSELTATLKKYKWMSDAEYEFTDFTTWAELTKDVFVYYFMSDTEGVLRHYHKWIDSSGIADEGLYVSNIYFAYTVNGNTVNIRFIDSNFPRVTFTYDSNYLRSEDGDVLKAVVPSTGDWAQAKALFPQTGTTGECTYTYDPRTKEMVISGNGAMGDYVAGKQPWAEFPMEEVTIEDGVTTIGNHAFYNIYTLQKVWISSNSNLRSIGVEAFAKSPIAFIDIPSKVEIIKEAAFSGCSNLGLIDFSKSTSLKTIETYAFSGVEKWQKKATGNYSGQQYYYKSLEVPASVESLGMVAFNGDIDEIVIGKNMRQMAGFAISTSVNNGKMYVNRGTPPTVNSSVLGERESSWTLYVPKGCKSAYQKDAVWKKFYKIIEDESLEKGDDYTGGNGDDNPSGGNTGYKTCPDNKHPHMIDLGLPSGTLWACCNVGASKPEEYGNYYAWGETSPKSVYSWSTYKWCSGLYDTQTKYCTKSSYGSVDNKTTLDSSDDAATVNWGTPWRMPSLDVIKELVDKCTSVQTSQNGVNGWKFTGPNGGVIFFPAAGIRWDGEPFDVNNSFDAGSYGFYWSSSLYESTPFDALVLYLGVGWYSDNVPWERGNGQSVRPVR